MRVNDFGIGLIDLLEKNEVQFRKSGEPYITHPIHVAKILASYESDSDAIIAALLHDTVEDTPVTIDEIKKEFGENVMQLVDGVTKLNKLSFNSREEQKNAACHGKRYPRYSDKTCGQASQYQNHGRTVRGKTPRKSA